MNNRIVVNDCGDSDGDGSRESSWLFVYVIVLTRPIRAVHMKSLVMLSSLLLATGLCAAGEPDWCEVEKNYPMERRGIGCLEACGKWREAAGVEVVEPYCIPEKYASYTFKDVEYQGEKLVCIVSVKCVSSGGP